MPKPVLAIEMQEALIQSALEVRQRAYAVYSHYHVGAALLSKDGQVFTGCNIENAAYPAGICAERTALVKAVSEGVREFLAVVVATDNGGSPCGICRQMLNEFAPEIWVILVDEHGQISLEQPLNELLPHSFSPSHLKSSQ